jgi:hypothetical protein
MKAQHRHELETNVLAKELNTWSEKLRPYSSMLLTGVAALLGFYAVFSIWNSYNTSREAAAWSAYQKSLLDTGAVSDFEFKTVRRTAASDDYAGSRMQEWAYVAWADRQLRLAANDYLLNRESATDRIKNVATVYESQSDNAHDSEVRNRARFGLARVREMQDRLDEAREEYAQVEGALQPLAAARLKELESGGKEVAEAAKWLATADLPKPVAPTGPGAPGVRPDFGAAPPSAEGATTSPLDASRTLEEILGGADEAGDRYGEDAASAAEGAEDAVEADDATDGADAATEPAESAPAESEQGSDAAAEATSATEEPAAEATAAPPATEPTGTTAPAGDEAAPAAESAAPAGS